MDNIAIPPSQITAKDIKETRKIIDSVDTVLSKINPKLASSGRSSSTMKPTSKMTSYQGNMISVNERDNRYIVEIRDQEGKVYEDVGEAESFNTAFFLAKQWINENLSR
jgi:hypothetical protein